MASPTDLRYTESHEWARVEGDMVTLGITRFAVDELTDITYVDLPEAGSSVGAGDPVCEVESVKATSDVYSPVGGEIVEVNEALNDDPSLINQDPYEKGWLVKLRATDTSPLDAMLSAAAYDESNS